MILYASVYINERGGVPKCFVWMCTFAPFFFILCDVVLISMGENVSNVVKSIMFMHREMVKWC